MSIFQNKLFLVHITCEIVTIGAIVYMLNRKNKFLLNEINRLENIITEQNKLLKQHTNLINQLFEMLKTKELNVKPKNSEISLKATRPEEISPSVSRISNKDTKELEFSDDNKIPKVIEQNFETESQLDRSIENELNELNDVE